MNIKDVLEKPYLMNEKILYTKNQIEECEMYIDRLSPKLNNNGAKVRLISRPKEDSIINLIIYREKLINEVNTLYEHKLNVTNMIDNLDSEFDKLIMKKHYINYEPWTKISEDLSMSYQTIYTHHKTSLKELEERFFSYKRI